MGRCPRPRCGDGPPAGLRSSRRVRRELATPSIVPTRARTMLRMKASAVIRKARISAFVGPGRGEDVALEADVVGLGRGEGGEVVGADEGGGAGVERLAVDLVRPPERPAVLERARDGPGRHPVEVGARAGVEAGVEAVGDHLGAAHGDVVRASRRSGCAPGRAAAAPRCRSSPPVPGRGRRCRCGPPRSAGSPRAAPAPAPPRALPARSAAPAGGPSRGSRCRRIRCPGGRWSRRQYRRRRRRTAPASLPGT